MKSHTWSAILNLHSLHMPNTQGFYKLESQGKSYQNQGKSGKSGKVRESQGNYKISEWSQGRVREKDSGAFQNSEVQNFLQPWWKYSLILQDIYENSSLWRISEHYSWKIFFKHGESILYFLRYLWKSFILKHFRTVEVKFFFNHGESILYFLRYLWKSFILKHFRTVEFKIFFNHGESILRYLWNFFWTVSEQQNSKHFSIIMII